MDSLKNQDSKDALNNGKKRKGPKARELSPIEIKRLNKPGLHAVGGVPGLLLQISATGAKSWIYRYRFNGKRRHEGFGSYPGITLATARELARKSYEKIIQGIDPLALKAQTAGGLTFDEAAKQFIADHTASWRNPKHAQQWTNTLATYANPFIGYMNVAAITKAHVLAVLEQPVTVIEDGKPQTQKLWLAKRETASRVRGRMKLVFDWCTGREYRSGTNPAEWTGNLDSVLSSPKAMASKNPVEHHPAVQIDDLPAFAKGLASSEGMAAKALQLKLLTAVRSNEVRGACWAEFDLDNGLWTVPKSRTKTGKTEHSVALSEQALLLLRSLPRLKDCKFVFPGPSGKPLSDTALSKIMQRLNFKDKDGRVAVPHGLRSSFRGWVAERTNFDGFLAQVALHHVVGNKVETAYQRSNVFERRKALMQAWADYCTGEAPANQ